jgi:hypothetical protein
MRLTPEIRRQIQKQFGWKAEPKYRVFPVGDASGSSGALFVLIDYTLHGLGHRLRLIRRHHRILQAQEEKERAAPPSTPPRADRSRQPTPCAAPTAASRRSRHSPARAPDHCARTECCVPDTSALLAPSRSAVAVAARFVVCAAPLFGIYSSSFEMPSASQSFWLVAAKLCYDVRAFRAFRLHAEPQTRLYSDWRTGIESSTAETA